MRIIRTLARAIQTLSDFEPLQPVLIPVSSVLHSAIRVKNGRPLTAPLTNGMLEGSKRQLRGSGSAERPAQNTPRIPIHDRRQIQPALFDPQIGHISNPGLVDTVNAGVILKQIFPGDPEGLQRWPSLGHAGQTTPDLVLSHQPLYALLAYSNRLLAEQMMDSGAPVGGAALGMDNPDPFEQSLIFPLPLRRQTLAPIVVAAARYLQPTAQKIYFELLPVSLDELVAL